MLAFLVSVGLIAMNLTCIYLENKDPLFAERALVEYLSSHQGVVYTDPMTSARAELLLDFKGISLDRV